MKSRDHEKRALERLRADIELEQLGLDSQRLREAEERAHEAYLRREKKRQRGRSLRRRVMVGAAATLAILVVSFAYTVISPSAVSTANNALRRASIWVNDKLHLGIRFDVPVDDAPKVDLDTVKTYASMDAALAELGVPLVGFAPESGAVLERIEAVKLAEGDYRYSITYQVEGKAIQLIMENLGDETVTAILDEKRKEMATPLGIAICWMGEEGWKGEMLVNPYQVRIISGLEFDTLNVICQYLTIVTEL